MGKHPPRVAPLDPPGAAFVLISWVVRRVLPLFGTRQYFDSHFLPKRGPAIVACNHISLLDPLALGAAMFDNGRVPRFLGKASLFKIPIVGAILRSGGQIPVERRSTNASAALVPAGRVLDEGGCVAIYPEGTLTHDENNWPMRGKTGAVRLALLSGAPLIPAAVWGTADAYPPKARFPRFSRSRDITAIFGAPVDLTDLAGRAEDADALRTGTARLMAAITELVARLRDERPPGSAEMST